MLVFKLSHEGYTIILITCAVFSIAGAGQKSSATLITKEKIRDLHQLIRIRVVVVCRKF